MKIFLDMQANINFIIEGFENISFKNYKIILITCSIEEIKKIFNFYIPGIEITDDMIKKLEQVSGIDIRNTAKQLAKLSIKENKDVNKVIEDYFNKM